MLITCLTNVASLCKMFNFRGNWVKGIWELSMILLQLFCKFKVIPKISLFKKTTKAAEVREDIVIIA